MAFTSVSLPSVPHSASSYGEIVDISCMTRTNLIRIVKIFIIFPDRLKRMKLPPLRYLFILTWMIELSIKNHPNSGSAAITNIGLEIQPMGCIAFQPPRYYWGTNSFTPIPCRSMLTVTGNENITASHMNNATHQSKNFKDDKN